MAGGFVKLYGDRLLGSSLMDEAVETRWLFLCFAAAADETGYVRCQTIGNAARIANLTHDQARAALDALSSPDAESTSPDEDGRRLVRAEGGWRVVNHGKYREMRTERQVRNAEYQAKHRLISKASKKESAEVSASLSVVSVSVEGGGGGDPAAAPATAPVPAPFYRPPGPANPLVAGRRADLERECLALVREVAAVTGEDPVEVIAQASGYKGAATTKLNPATMSDDRLANTVRDLRADAAELRLKAAK